MEILNLNRMNDALFKNIFAQNSDITLSLINAVFEFQGTALITDIEFIDRNLDIEEEGGKEYGIKIFGSVTTLNAKGEVENCVVTSGGTIMGPDEETLREIELERIKKLKRKELNAELLEQARIEYIMTKNSLII